MSCFYVFVGLPRFLQASGIHCGRARCQPVLPKGRVVNLRCLVGILEKILMSFNIPPKLDLCTVYNIHYLCMHVVKREEKNSLLLD